jgi:putative endopeptidase
MTTAACRQAILRRMSDRTPYLDRTLMDLGTAPGVDFYRHANGGWLDGNPVPAEYPAWGAFLEIHVRNQDLLHQLLQDAATATAPADPATAMVGDYFAAGMDEAAIAVAGLRPLQPLLDGIDGVTSVHQLGTVLAALQRVGVGALFGFDVEPDFDRSDRYLVYVGQGGLGLPEREYYVRDDERSVALRTAYEQHVATQLANAGAGADDAARAAAAILDLETRLARSSYTAEQLRDLQLTLNRVEASELDELMPRFGLGAHLRRFGITPSAVSINNPDFFRDLDGLLADEPVETVRAYLRWHLLRAFASALPPAFEDAAFAFYGRTLGGQQEQQPRWKRILGAASSDIGEQVAKLYVDAAFSAEAKARCEAMVEQLIAAMERSIRSADWMTDETRAAALTKVGTFTHKIGYPDRWRDYTGLTIEPDAHAANRMRAAWFERQRRLDRLDEPVDTTEWEMPAHVVNAYYNPLLNEIVFPAGILQPPMFWADGDDAGNFGAIGAVIGHEITHGFDDQGSQFDEAGRHRVWWTDADRAEFDRRAEELVAQVDAYEVTDDQHVNGRLTLGENIADLGGVAIAFDAWRHAGAGDRIDVEGWTPEQRFFLSYASMWRMNYTDEYLRLLVNVDVHAPNPVRVNGPLSNFPPFARAFGLAGDAPLRRPERDRVAIW